MKRWIGMQLPMWLLTGMCLFVHPGAQAQTTGRMEALTGMCAEGGDPAAALATIVHHGVTGDAAERTWADRIVAAIKGGAFICATPTAPLIVDGDHQLDAATLAEVHDKTSEPAYVPSMVMMRKLAIVSAELDLSSNDVALRRQAAEQIDKFHALLDQKVVETVLEKEHDQQVKSTLSLALAKRGLDSDSKTERLRSIEIIGKQPSQASRTMLSNVLSDANVDADLARAARSAISSIDNWLLAGKICSILFSGLSYAGILLLTALGLSIVFGLMGVINLAHGEFIMIGAYSTYVVEQLMQAYTPSIFSAYIFVAIPFAFIVCALFGMILEYCVIRFLYRRPLETLLATWAVSIAVIKLVQLTFGSQNVEFITPGFLNGGAQLFAGFFVTYNRIFAILLAAAIFVATLLVVRHTRFGLLIRATTQRRDTARCLGVPAERIDRLAFGMGAGLAGLAGVVLTQIASVNPSMGTSFVIDAFMVVVLGGAGSLIGTGLSSLALGEINQIIEPMYGSVAAKVAVLLLIVLIIQRRPQGLFASKTRV
jgi:urea transport system permease protein